MWLNGDQYVWQIRGSSIPVEGTFGAQLLPTDDDGTGIKVYLRRGPNGEYKLIQRTRWYSKEALCIYNYFQLPAIPEIIT